MVRVAHCTQKIRKCHHTEGKYFYCRMRKRVVRSYGFCLTRALPLIAKGFRPLNVVEVRE